MPVAEDVAAFAAVVAADEVVECAFAGWIVADGGFGIGLFVVFWLVWKRKMLRRGVESLPSSANG